MNYRHIYHAGNFADVIKHIILVAVIDSLKKKNKPFAILDTHAGIGLYNLKCKETQKKQEYLSGIHAIISSATDAPNLVKQYLQLIARVNDGDELSYYPGSPLISLASIRAQDRLILCELHREDITSLRKNIKKNSQVAIHHLDGYLGLKAFLPPKEARGLVLIDPPFEKTTEFDDIHKAVSIALKRWRNGVYAIWYPIKNSVAVKKFSEKLAGLKYPICFVEFTLLKAFSDSGMSACGIAIINVPWQLPTLIHDEFLPYLTDTLGGNMTVNFVNQ